MGRFDILTTLDTKPDKKEPIAPPPPLGEKATQQNSGNPEIMKSGIHENLKSGNTEIVKTRKPEKPEFRKTGNHAAD
jgi:hypothetical protein